MTYGFTVRNGNGEITVSDKQFNPVYVGLATFQPPATYYSWGAGTTISYTGAYVTSVYGVSWINFAIAKYNITFPTSQGKPIPFIIQDERIVNGASINSIKQLSSSGGNTTWQITVNVSNGRANTIAGQPRVMVFASIPPNDTPTGYGLVLKAGDESPLVSDSIAFSSNLKHLIPTHLLNYSSSTVVRYTFPNSGGQQKSLVSYNSRQLLSNLPTTSAFFYLGGVFDILYNGFVLEAHTMVGRLNGNYFESSVCIYPGAYSGAYNFSQTRGNEPVIIIDASKYL